MMTMMRTMVKRAISIFIGAQALLIGAYFISHTAFINAEVGFLSAFFIILGSSYAYKRMVQSKVANGEYVEERELLDKIEDPHELFDDKPINDAPYEELDLKSIIKEEKAKVKNFSVKNIKYGAKGGISAFRIVPYVLLVLGFIALKNNELLSLWYYLPALTFGIIIGAFVSKEAIV